MTGKKSSFAKRLMWILFILAVISAGGFYYWKYRAVPNKVTFEKAELKKGNLAVTILATGTVQPKNRLEIKPPIAGRIDQVFVEEGTRVKKGGLLASMSSTERAALIDAARAEGDQELKKWEDLYRSTPILAPIDGMIILRNVEAGQTFTSNDSILVMSDRLTIKAQVDETDIAKIKVGMLATILLDAYAEEKISGKVDQISYEARTVNNVTTYYVDVSPDATPDFVRSGMTANVTFIVSEKKDILLLPTEAIEFQQGKSYVWFATDEKSKPERHEVTLGMSDGKQFEVTAGLSGQENIVIRHEEQSANNSKSNKASSPLTPMGRMGGGRSASGRGAPAHP